MPKFNNVEDFYAYKPKPHPKKQVLVGCSTCGIAAGANKVFTVLQQEIKKRGIQNVELKKVGCLGLCYCEPNVEVKVPGLPDILYGKVDEALVLRILELHVCDNNIVNENIYDKPVIDIYSPSEAKNHAQN